MRQQNGQITWIVWQHCWPLNHSRCARKFCKCIRLGWHQFELRCNVWKKPPSHKNGSVLLNYKLCLTTVLTWLFLLPLGQIGPRVKLGSLWERPAIADAIWASSDQVRLTLVSHKLQCSLGVMIKVIQYVCTQLCLFLCLSSYARNGGRKSKCKADLSQWCVLAICSLAWKGTKTFINTIR